LPAGLVAQSCNRHLKTLLPLERSRVCHHPTSFSILDLAMGAAEGTGDQGEGVKVDVNWLFRLSK
jgi:hypothetical protein